MSKGGEPQPVQRLSDEMFRDQPRKPALGWRAGQLLKVVKAGKGLAVTPSEEGPESFGAEIGHQLMSRLAAGLGRERSGPGLKQVGDRSGGH